MQAVVAGMDDYEDEPFEATWSAELKSFGYHDSIGRWITVTDQDIAACRVDYGLALAKMLVAFERAGPSRPTTLNADLIWDAGTIKLAGAKAPVPRLRRDDDGSSQLKDRWLQVDLCPTPELVPVPSRTRIRWKRTGARSPGSHCVTSALRQA